MTDLKRNRTIEEVTQEYGALCARAGNLQYNIVIMQNDLELINETLRTLNHEAALIKAGEQSSEASVDKSELAKVEALIEKAAKNA